MTTEYYNDLLKEYKKLAKRADQRLVRIEKATSSKKGMENLKKFAYQNAMEDIQRFGGKNRYNSNTPTTTQELKAKIRVIEKFLDYKTSTVTGTKQTYVKRVKTINEKYGTNFTWEEFHDFILSEEWRKLSKYGSKFILKAIGKLDKKGIDLVKDLKEFTEKHKNTDTESFINEKLKKAGIKTLYKKEI